MQTGALHIAFAADVAFILDTTAGTSGDAFGCALLLNVRVGHAAEAQ